MGFFDRLGAVATGLGGAVLAPFGFAKDLAVGAFTDDDEFDSFLGTIWGASKKWGGSAVENLIGPDEGVGAAIGALPGSVRRGASTVIDPVFAGLETAGREAIREPLTALMSAASLMDAGHGFDLGRGYQIAQDRSLGQAIALAILTDDITDEVEVAKAVGTDWYDAISGTADALTRIMTEPDILAAKFYRGARKASVAGQAMERTVRLPARKDPVTGRAMVTPVKLPVGVMEQAGAYAAGRGWVPGARAIRTGRDLDAALVSPELATVNERITGIRREAGVEAQVRDLPEVRPVDETWRRQQVQVVTGVEDLPAAPGTARLLEATPPAAEGLPPLFHGTKAEVPGGQLDDTLAYDAQAGNLFGTGFYTTASEDIASSYQKKGARGARPDDEPFVYSVQWKGTEPPRVLDLDQPIAPEVRDIVARRLGEDSFVLQYLADDDVAELNRMLEAGETTASVYQKLRQSLADSGEVTRATADEMFTDLNWEIRDTLGVDALKHQGGVYAGKGKGPAHDVYIWLDPGKMTITARSKGASRQALENYEAAVARHGEQSTQATEARRALEAEEARFAKESAKREKAMAKEQARVEKIKKEATAKAAARIRDLAFHDHKHGETIATVLAEAPDLNVAWGALMGRRADIDQLSATNPALAGRIDREFGAQAKIDHMARSGAELPEEVVKLDLALKDREIGALYDPEPHLLAAERLEQAEGMVRELPHISWASEKRRNITRSAFYQESWTAAPLRLATNMMPRNMVNLEDRGGDIQADRILRQAGVADEVRDQLRGEMAGAVEAGARHDIMARVEAEAMRTLALKHGLSKAEAEMLVNKAARNNRMATDRIMRASRRYDGKGRAYIVDRGDDGVESRLYLPISKSQTANYYVTADWRAVDRVLADSKKEATRLNVTVANVLYNSERGLTAFNRIWKPSVLLRVGWPIRVVGEEQLRIMSQIGALITAGRTAVAASRYGRDGAIDAMNKVNQSLRRVPMDARVSRDPRLRGLKLGHENYRDWEMERAMGTPENPAMIYQQMNGARGGVDKVWGIADEDFKTLSKEVTEEWASLDPVRDFDSWGPGWEHAVNAQIRKDQMWGQFLAGKSVDEVADWVRNTKEGKSYLRSVPHWRKDIEGWLEAAAQVVDDYLPTPELKELALRRNVKVDDIVAAIPDAGSRPVVHGAIIKDIQGKTAFVGALARMRDKAMTVLGSLPTDVLSRQPYFDWHYTNEMRRLIDIATDQGVEFSVEQSAKFSKQARAYALGESKKLLYDLADESELAHTLRFISPFFNASQEVITRWTGIAVDNPAFVLRLHEVWKAPEKAGIVQDENGNTISADGTYATSALGERVEAGEDRFVSMRLLAQDNVLGKALFNDLTRALPGVKLVERARYNKDGFNTIMQMPGVGPIVQLPLNEIAKGRPELEESLKWALPFGATQNTLQAIMPATAKRFQTQMRADEDRQYANTVTRLYMDMMVDYNLEKRAEKPTYEEAQKKAKEFWKMRTIASFVSPVAPSFGSPYQLHIDKYRALMERDPATAMDKFLEEEGEDFFPLTQSLTKTMNGVPPTAEGAEAYQKYQDMVQRHPGLGGLIIGEEGAGEFSNSVYQTQLSTSLRPGSRDKQRTALSFEEVTKGTDIKLAWREYSRTMDLIDAERIQRGLPNLQVRGARDLASIKRQFIEKHGEKYPDWFAELNVVDRGAWNRKLAGLKEIAADDRLANREEIVRLGEYLEVRAAFVAELAARDAAGGSATLNASSNMDLAGMWEQVTGKMVERSLPFADLFHRYLERDPLTPDEEVAA